MTRHGRTEETAAWQWLYTTSAWAALREAQLDRQPLCERCLAHGKVVAASVVHHVKPHRGDEALFFDPDNLMSMCDPCHNGPVAREERRGYSIRPGSDGWPTDPKHPSNRGRKMTPRRGVVGMLGGMP